MSTKNTKTKKDTQVEIEDPHIWDVPFSKAELMELAKNGKVEETKAYIKRYYYKIQNPVSIFFWNADEQGFNQLTHDEFCKGHVTASVTYEHIKDKKVKEVTYSNWFRNDDTDDYSLVFDMKQPRIYEKENGTKCLNLFKGFKYANKKPKTITKRMTEGINAIWTHIKEVICSSDEQMYMMVKRWICHFLSGRKMKTILYLRGDIGLGKSTLPTFLRDVIGSGNVHKTSTNSCLTGRFNGELQGKLLLILEELKCASPSEWKQMNSSLNAMATEGTLAIECKNKDCINVVNNLSIIITANDSPIRVDKSDRRYVMMDISTHRRGDDAYFIYLYSFLQDETIQNAFYHDCLSLLQQDEYKNFNEEAELRKLESNIKKETVLKNLHPLFTYVKNKYVMKRKPFDIFLKTLTDDVNSSCGTHLLSIEVSRLLKEIGITGKASTGNKHRYKLTSDEIIEIFNKNKFIHEDEEFETEDDTDSTTALSVYTLSEIEAIVKRNQELQQRLDELDNNKKTVCEKLKKPMFKKITTQGDKKALPEKKTEKAQEKAPLTISDYQSIVSSIF